MLCDVVTHSRNPDQPTVRPPTHNVNRYIHRLGRTARAGKSGSGMLLLMREEERQMRRDLHDMPLISFVPAVSMTTLDATRAALARVSRNAELRKSAEQAYGAWLGYYNTNCKKCGWNKEQLVRLCLNMSGLKRVINLYH